MKILITGTSSGIGRAAAERFLEKGHEVYGIDIQEASVSHTNYHHYQADLRYDKLPEIEDIEILICNAGLQNSEDDIDNNLKATIRVAEKYSCSAKLRSVLFNASASARNGYEFPSYVASKAGVVGYMKNLACRLAPRGVTVNSLSLGGVLTSSNQAVIDDASSWKAIMDVTPLKKWMSLEEVSDWVYFLTITNRSMSGQDILVDNGENDLNNTFVWPQ